MQAEAIEVGTVPTFFSRDVFTRLLIYEITRLGMKKYEIEKGCKFLVVKD